MEQVYILNVLWTVKNISIDDTAAKCSLKAKLSIISSFEWKIEEISKLFGKSQIMVFQGE